MKSYLAFDLGASSGRAILGSVEQGKLVLRETHRFKNFPTERNGHFYWDFNHLFSEIKTGIKKSFEVEKDIVSISVDTWGVDYGFFRNGKLIRDPYAYRDGRNDRGMEIVHGIISKEELYAETGIQLMNFNTIYQLAAHKEDHPEDFENGSVMLQMPDALLYMLSGAMTNEYTIASTGALLNPNTRSWNRKVLDKVGIPESIFGKIVMPSSLSASLTPEICKELGVPAIATVKCGSHDTASAVASMPCPGSSSDRLYISMGTWALLGAELDSPKTDSAAFDAHYTNEGGLLGKIRFLCNIMGTWLLQETKRNWNEAGRDIGFPEIAAMAKTVNGSKFRIDPNDLTFFQPCNMPEKVREYCKAHGQGDSMTDAEVVRCIYDSLCDCFRDSIHKLEKLLSKKYTVLHILGGGTKDKFFMQQIANVTGLKVITGPTEATAAGNILSQMIAAGALHDLNEARSLIKASFPVEEYDPE